MAYEKEIDHFETESGEVVGLKDPYAREEVAKKIQNPSTAKLGDILVVKKVDEEGRPTEWEAIKNDYNLIADITVEEGVTQIIVDEDLDGNPLNLSEAVVVGRVSVPPNEDGSALGNGVVYILPNSLWNTDNYMSQTGLNSGWFTDFMCCMYGKFNKFYGHKIGGSTGMYTSSFRDVDYLIKNIKFATIGYNIREGSRFLIYGK